MVSSNLWLMKNDEKGGTDWIDFPMYGNTYHIESYRKRAGSSPGETTNGLLQWPWGIVSDFGVDFHRNKVSQTDHHHGFRGWNFLIFSSRYHSSICPGAVYHPEKRYTSKELLNWLIGRSPGHIVYLAFVAFNWDLWLYKLPRKQCWLTLPQ